MSSKSKKHEIQVNTKETTKQKDSSPSKSSKRKASSSEETIPKKSKKGKHDTASGLKTLIASYENTSKLAAKEKEMDKVQEDFPQEENLKANKYKKSHKKSKK